MDIQALFAKARQQDIKTVELAGFGAFHVKPMTAADTIEQQEYFLSLEKNQAQVLPLNVAEFALRKQIVDENGKPFLTRDDVLAMPSDLVFAIFNAICENTDRLNIAQVDEIAKKSSANPS